MESLRVNTGIKIEVNDNGDFITAYVSDQNFIGQFYEMVEKLNEEAEYMSAENVNRLNTAEQIRMSAEASKRMMHEIDNTFGEDTCKKVFGPGVVPTGYAIAELFEQLIPVFEKYADERQKKIGKKYDRNRKGNRQQRRGR